MKKLLEIKNLKTFFTIETGIVKAVDGITFSLNQGETLGIVGESGSGKSVTALSIMQLVPASGKILDGEILLSREDKTVDLLKLSKKNKIAYRGKDISMIFQEPMSSLNPVFKCGEQITEAILANEKVSKKEAKKRTYDLLEKVKLSDVERIYNAFPHQLSGGQKQRVMIAMALSTNPKILIADEPTTALDVTIQKSILNLLKELKEEFNTSIIFISHDLGVIKNIADRVVVMFKGKIVETGKVKDIFNNAQHPYTKSLLACRPPLDFKLERLPVSEDFMEIFRSEEGVFEVKEKEIDKSKPGFRKITKEEISKRLSNLKSQPSILKVENLCTYFSSNLSFLKRSKKIIKAVDKVSFEVFEGETLGIVGESGSGKTTLGRSILQLLPIESGDIFYNGVNLSSLSEENLRSYRKEIQIIFQDPYASLNPAHTIGEAISEPLYVHKMADKNKVKEFAIDLLNSVGINQSYFNHYPHQLSGGQRQRVCIARALALKPKFLICDECVSSLDVSVQAKILNLLLDLRGKYNLTYIFISHDLSVVKFMSDRILVMKAGKIVEMGEADTVYHSPEEDYTRELISAIPK